MISPKKKSDTINTAFIAADIENRRNGKMFHVETYDGNEYISHKRWADWWSYLLERAADDERFRTVYAHNGGGWDWLSFVEWYMNAHDEARNLTFTMTGSKMLLVTIEIEKEFTIRLCDSLNLFYAGLDSVGKKFLGRGKVEIPGHPEDIARENPELFREYVRGDVNTLYHSVVKLCEILHEISGIDSLGITLPATALKVFRAGYLKRDLWTPKHKDLRKILREGYRGGRVEVFRPGYHPKVRVYDINSLYPAIMRTVPVPVSAQGFWTKNYHPYALGVYRINFKQTRRAKAVLNIGGHGVYEGSGVFFSPELNLLREVDKKSQVEIVEGFVFEETGPIFRPYVDELYRLRMSDVEGPLGEVCKRLLNSLYGKFGQNPVRENLFLLRDGSQLEDMVDAGSIITPVDEARGLWSVQEEKECRFEHVGIAGTITSAARVALYRHFDDRTIYCDTDSVHTTGEVQVSATRELGGMKLEFEGEGVYAGKKLYAIRSPKVTKIRVKGVRVGDPSKPKTLENGANVEFDDIRRLIDGESKTCYYRTPTTPRETFAGREPCIFRKRSRTIRRTANVLCHHRVGRSEAS